MLNKILQQLNGHGSEAASLEAALVQLGRDRDETRTSIAELNKRRHQMLLDDASDADLDKIERQIDRATTRLEKLNLSDAPLQERIAAAMRDAKKKAVAKHFDLIVSAYVSLRGTVLAAEAAQTAMFAARAAAVREVGEHAIAAFPVFVFGGILGQGFAASWAAEFDSRLESFRASRAPRAPRPATTGTTAPAARPKKPASLQHPIGLNSGVEIPPKLFSAKRAPDDEAPLKPGQVRVKVLRHGYSPADDRPQCHFGQLIQLPRTTAERVAAAGVVEIIESQELRP